jgi:hypothetical protein
VDNPFSQNTTSYHDWNILKDLEWHCTKCELKSGQAKTWQIWRDEKGIQFEEPTPRRWEKRIFCKQCNKVTSHRKLKTLELLQTVSIRTQITPKFAKKVKDLYKREEAVLLRKLSDRELEIDHKFPQIRWNTNECDNDKLTDQQIKDKFILLNRNNNLWKSRQCEACFLTGKRGSFPGIYFWYSGDENWRGDTKHDENGCIGCFWYDPYAWRSELNKVINKNLLKNS